MMSLLMIRQSIFMEKSLILSCFKGCWSNFVMLHGPKLTRLNLEISKWEQERPQSGHRMYNFDGCPHAHLFGIWNAIWDLT